MTLCLLCSPKLPACNYKRVFHGACLHTPATACFCCLPAQLSADLFLPARWWCVLPLLAFYSACPPPCHPPPPACHPTHSGCACTCCAHPPCDGGSTIEALQYCLPTHPRTGGWILATCAVPTTTGSWLAVGVVCVFYLCIYCVYLLHCGDSQARWAYPVLLTFVLGHSPIPLVHYYLCAVFDVCLLPPMQCVLCTHDSSPGLPQYCIIMALLLLCPLPQHPTPPPPPTPPPVPCVLYYWFVGFPAALLGSPSPLRLAALPSPFPSAPPPAAQPFFGHCLLPLAREPCCPRWFRFNHTLGFPRLPRFPIARLVERLALTRLPFPFAFVGCGCIHLCRVGGWMMPRGVGELLTCRRPQLRAHWFIAACWFQRLTNATHNARSGAFRLLVGLNLTERVRRLVIVAFPLPLPGVPHELPR